MPTVKIELLVELPEGCNEEHVDHKLADLFESISGELIDSKLYLREDPDARLEIEPMLTISSDHLTQETQDALREQALTSLVVYEKEEFGWFIFIGDPQLNEDTENWPVDLAEVIHYALERGVTWLCIDHDAQTAPGLNLH